MSGPTHVIVTDEGYLLWQEHPGNINREPLFARDIGMWREARIAAMLSTNYTGLSPTIRANLHTQIFLTVAGGQEAAEVARVLGLSPEQREYLERHLTCGEAIALFADGWRYPVHLRIPKNEASKDVLAEDWEEARRRINNLLPEGTTIPTGISLPAVDPVTTPAPLLALTNAEERLLTATAPRPIPATAAYTLAGLHPQTADRAQKKLVTLNLLRAERVAIRPGRGGSAVLLAPTRAGYERIGKPMPRGTRGGDSLAHFFYVTELGEALGAVIETKVGDKAIDVLLRFDPTKHVELPAFLRRQSPSDDALNAINALGEGSLLAIEVEVSDPAKTAPANVRRNRANGIALSLVTLRKPLDAMKSLLRQSLTAADGPWLVADVLHLLNHARTSRGSDA
jgi:hypothetical protein